MDTEPALPGVPTPPPAGRQRPGEVFWRSLDELAEDPGFRRWVSEEFPPSVLQGLESEGRREFLKVMAASFALAGLASCERPREQIVPYTYAESRIIPGEPLLFASSLTHGGYAHGVVVRSDMGRPTKIDGNPDHPATLGASSAADQAAILGLYDPDRSQTVRVGGGTRSVVGTWEQLGAALAGRMPGLAGGKGLHILTGAVTSPTLLAQLGALLEAMPGAAWSVHEPVGHEAIIRGMRLATGRWLEPNYRFDQAAVVVSLDCNFLYELPGHVRYERDFGSTRRPRAGGGTPTMSRLYAAEADMTVTGACADHRLAVRRSAVPTLALALARRLGAAGEIPDVQLAPAAAAWADAAAADLAEARGNGGEGGRSIVLAGIAQPPAVHALVLAINEALGNVGRTVTLIEPVAGGWSGDGPRSLADLTRALESGAVDTLLIIGANPAYTAPADVGFADALRGAPMRIHAGLYFDETAHLCDWHVPLAHELETWSDARAYDGTAGIIQPLIAPLYQGRSAHQILGMLHGPPGLADDARLHAQWAPAAGGDFGAWWRGVLTAGVIPGTAAAAVNAPSRPDAIAEAVRSLAAAPAADGRIELAIDPDPTVWDGRDANNGWLQELPKPLDRIAWDNAIHVSPATAARLGLRDQTIAEVSAGGRTVDAAVLIMPGHADDAVTLTLGYGRTAAGRTGSGLGFDAYRLRLAASPGLTPDVQLRPTRRPYELANVQGHYRLDGQDLVHTGTLAEFIADPSLGRRQELRTVHLSFYPTLQDEAGAIDPEQGGEAGVAQWGMSIDMSACSGCQACVVACNAENNIPVVGKAQVLRGREMQWLRIDRYFSGPAEAPRAYRQPILCMHCEKAPCELVCPVGATQHSADGLNEMVYNRCVGTRYCSHNCPYKVRRFNFFRYAQTEPEVLRLMRNPTVSVRSRGVMEKCTYCVQRIRAAEIKGRVQGRPTRDFGVETACQQACPSRAIVFGDLTDPGSEVSKLKRQPHDYGLLVDLNTQPRTTYLAVITNPSPAYRGPEA